jgi:hypothetical protein
MVEGIVGCGMNEEVEHFPLVVKDAPEPVALAVDLHDHLVEISMIAGAGPQASQVCHNARAEIGEPAADGLKGDIDTTLAEHLLVVADSICALSRSTFLTRHHSHRRPL